MNIFRHQLLPYTLLLPLLLLSPFLHADDVPHADEALVVENCAGRLWKLQDDDGSCFVSYEQGRVKSQITASDENLVFRLFDATGRVIREVLWDSTGTHCLKEVEYTYTEQRVLPESISRWDPELQQLSVTRFNDAGLKIEQRDYTGVQQPAESALVTVLEWRYDSRNRITEEKQVYPEKNLTLQVLYRWHDARREPDEWQYENGTLVREVMWKNDTEYREMLFFDNGFEILNDYTNGRQVLEVVVQNDVEIRRTSW